MDCRKARYFLVASFDQPLPEADQKNLAYHLKDCRACRHEAFYYRELFSAEKQVPVRQPRADFNERLLSEIRLREARSAWPAPAPEPSRRRVRWALVYVPALFGAVAALSFFAFLPEQPAPTESSAGIVVAQRDPSPVPQAQLDRPRYVPLPRHDGQSASGMMFEWPPVGNAQDAASDPFRALLVSQPSNPRIVRTRFQEQYVLPVVTQTVEHERIY
jgi:hypothetical protein